MTQPNSDTPQAIESGVWWDGVLNPMSPAGLRSAMREESPDVAFSASDIRWVAWPGMGQQVHVSQVDDLLPGWESLESKRLKHRMLVAFGLLLWFAWEFAKDYRVGMFLRLLQAGGVVLGLSVLAKLALDLQRMKRDPKGWGLVRSRKDARLAGLVLKD